LLATSMADTLLSRQFLPTMKYVFINVACHINGRHTFISPVPVEIPTVFRTEISRQRSRCTSRVYFT
jgi:hypothetical protein